MRAYYAYFIIKALPPCKSSDGFFTHRNPKNFTRMRILNMIDYTENVFCYL